MYRKPRIGFVTISDNREKAHTELLPVNIEFENYVIDKIREYDDFELVTSDVIVHTAREAVEAAHKLNAAGIDGLIMNFTIWVYPNLAVILARNIDKPILMLSNLHPERAGLVGMMASAGSLDQMGRQNYRVWGDIARPEVYEKVVSFARACSVVNGLKGSVYGMFGGRSMGMYTGVAEQSVWMQKFGIDCEHIDEMEILRNAELVNKDRIERAFEWLTENIGEIKYNGEGLTPEKLHFQIACYLATKDMIKERELDFIGIKCQPEMGNHFVTQCLTQAFSNDFYDMEGDKDITVCSCENDMDGGLTMQMLHLLTGLPTLFFDFRHYDMENDVFVFSNCGSQSTYYAARSRNCKENLCKVKCFAQTPEFYPAGGATVRYMAAPGQLTCARLTRKDGKYRMVIFPAQVETFPEEKMLETSNEWPQAFVRINVTPEQLINIYGSNHAHAVEGYHVKELVKICEMLDIESIVLE